MFPAILLTFPFIVWAGFRSDSWGDTYSYRTMFNDAPSSLSGLGQYVQEATKDQGFSALVVIIKTIFGNSDIIFFFIIALIQMCCVIYIYRKYSSNFWLSIFLFIAAGEYLSWMHNGMRQFLAVSIVFVSLEFVLKKRYGLVIIVIFLAATIHASALIMLPGIFIIQGKAWNKKTIIALLAALVAVLMINRFTDILELLLSDTQYSTAVSQWESSADDGVSPIRVLVYSIPIILSLIGLKWIKREDNPMINLAVNSGICAIGIFGISIFSSGIFIGRLPIYFYMLSQGILLPWEIKNIFTHASQKILLCMTVVCYIIYFYYQVYVIWGLA